MLEMSTDNCGRHRVPLEQLWITEIVEMLKEKIFKGINCRSTPDVLIKK
ncbi:hypothetical protein PVOR_09260 [Paenibacillus vortex V453]|uniref:Uncharacterized protein n=1 Tax=Paenibacillus vortex V453 TaxID=715225 RepID=A0A2R9SYR2_9BACL|nr:hypothetical protein PVOR_09260 [Paenibacillus vortex V453]